MLEVRLSFGVERGACRPSRHSELVVLQSKVLAGGGGGWFT